MSSQVPCPLGHEEVAVKLRADLPQATLLLGPESTGKWLLGLHLADCHTPRHAQCTVRSMSIGDARLVQLFLGTWPNGPHSKIVIADLDGAASLAAMHALLKSLEEPPEYARLILTASRPPLATIASRCRIVRTGLLTDDQVAAVLAGQGVEEREAAAAAPFGRGRVGPALLAAARYRPAKTAVLGAVRAMMTRDRDLLERMVRDWGDTEDWMLRELLGSAASGKSTPLFSTPEQRIIGKTRARQALAMLTASGMSRPAVRVRALAGAFMTEKLSARRG